MAHYQDETTAQHQHQHQQQQLQTQSVQLAVSEQIWLELVRELAAQGVLNAEALAQRLEQQAQRAPEVGGWFFGLTGLAQRLRQTSSDPDSLVQ